MYYVSDYISIFLFLIPLLHAVNLGCRLYASINLVWLIAGFNYHYSSYINNGEVKGIVKLFGFFDVLSIHILIPYIIYHSTYNNYYYYAINSCYINRDTCYLCNAFNSVHQ